MNIRNSIVSTIIVVLTLFVTQCNPQPNADPVLIPTETLLPIDLTETPTLTPTSMPTNTPTITPTPIGGKSGLLLHQVVCPQSGDCAQKVFLYNLISHELIPFLEEFTPLDVSPDGKKVLLKRKGWETGDLLIVDILQPEPITLLQENVDDAAWLGDSGWIGFISKVDGKGQVFLVHPDGSNLTQVTDSSVGAVTLEPVFNDGVFWGEGTIDGNGAKHINEYKWTKLDGTDTQLPNFIAASPSGKHVITWSINFMSPDSGCIGCSLELFDVATGEAKEFQLSQPSPDIELSFPGVHLLSDEKWLVEKSAATATDTPLYWIYTSDGSVFAELPIEYSVVDENNALLSPDGTGLLVSQFEKISDDQFKVTYHFFDTTTSEIKDLPKLHYISTGMKIVGNRRIDGVIEGARVERYFWIEIP